MGGASEAAFTWDALIDGALNGQLRVRRTVSVEDGHMVALPEGYLPPGAAHPQVITAVNKYLTLALCFRKLAGS